MGEDEEVLPSPPPQLAPAAPSPLRPLGEHNAQQRLSSDGSEAKASPAKRTRRSTASKQAAPVLVAEGAPNSGGAKQSNLKQIGSKMFSRKGDKFTGVEAMPESDESERSSSFASHSSFERVGELPKNAPEQTRSKDCLLYTSPSPRDATLSRMPSSA